MACGLQGELSTTVAAAEGIKKSVDALARGLWLAQESNTTVDSGSSRGGSDEKIALALGPSPAVLNGRCIEVLGNFDVHRAAIDADL
eukprot:505513-Pelagomonas_calceolata.AAC.2